LQPTPTALLLLLLLLRCSQLSLLSPTPPTTSAIN